MRDAPGRPGLATGRAQGPLTACIVAKIAVAARQPTLGYGRFSGYCTAKHPGRVLHLRLDGALVREFDLVVFHQGFQTHRKTPQASDVFDDLVGGFGKRTAVVLRVP